MYGNMHLFLAFIVVFFFDIIGIVVVVIVIVEIDAIVETFGVCSIVFPMSLLLLIANGLWLLCCLLWLLASKHHQSLHM